MAERPEYMVRFGNRAAVQDLAQARERIDELFDEHPYIDGLLEVRELLADVWDGLSFSVKE